mmetsp:Transcript_28782/g.37320  ORF Transcript_28782/g.37320 Transcript_28782/m.37320 type:complete len:96 (-) Transcript_28782:858-1145(-)|eukprot:CAMPEP_0117797494 /NCGR_PEP_ID=MMETSP0948-20121206/12564_1 /TAXON_ID=44440 /ORGANISM="Chattonella subsalsa, Strain CCMP2191" /LENGTH=95 /DNA_ID=CAMNT_0005628905 /DNA_START=291 /DNA_END=578 /DNA_ORIENTATION=+
MHLFDPVPVLDRVWNSLDVVGQHYVSTGPTCPPRCCTFVTVSQPPQNILAQLLSLWVEVGVRQKELLMLGQQDSLNVSLFVQLSPAYFDAPEELG